MRAGKLIGGALGFYNSSFVLILFGILLLVSLVFPSQASNVLLGVGYLCHISGETWRNLF